MANRANIIADLLYGPQRHLTKMVLDHTRSCATWRRVQQVPAPIDRREANFIDHPDGMETVRTVGKTYHKSEMRAASSKPY
jgi:hypothetical protein